MSVTPGLGAFNKDKVANKFGIQLKKKETNENCVQSPLSPSMEMESTMITETSTVTKNNTVSDFRSQNQSNGFASETLSNDRSSLSPSKSNESTSKPMGQSSKSKSTAGLMTTTTTTTTMSNDNRKLSSPSSPSPISTSNHSNDSSCPVNSNELIQSPSDSSVSTDRRSSPINDDPSVASVARSLLQEVNPVEGKASCHLSLSPSLAKTDAQIEHQKDQPLYKRQLSKTLDNSTSVLMNKHKHPHEHLIVSTTDSTR